MASRAILAFFIMNNAFFIKQIHKPKLITTAMKMPDKCRAGKNGKSFLNSIGIA